LLIDGSERLRERPLKPLLLALERAGAVFSFSEQEYSLPLRIEKGVDLTCTDITIDGSMSSQFVSALLLIAPYFENGLTLSLHAQPASEPYIDMTVALMRSAGVRCTKTGRSYTVPAGSYDTGLPIAEADWSAASFVYAWAAVSETVDVFLPGLRMDSLQGDAVVATLMESFGVLSLQEADGVRLSKKYAQAGPVHWNVQSIPDAFPVLCALGVLKNIELRFTGIENLRYKESDRLQAMEVNLRQCGAIFTYVSETEVQIKRTKHTNETYKFKSFGDHRIAMACSLFAFENEVELDDETVVSKSFPRYWEVFDQAFYR
jgi:3-phosphoshikimate 1-carboxyvinyltransferase